MAQQESPPRLQLMCASVVHSCACETKGGGGQKDRMQLLQCRFEVSGSATQNIGASTNSTSLAAKLARANSPHPFPSPQRLTCTEGGHMPCSVHECAREKRSPLRMRSLCSAADGFEAEALHAVALKVGLTDGGGSHSASASSTTEPKSRGRPNNSSKSSVLPLHEMSPDETAIERATNSEHTQSH